MSRHTISTILIVIGALLCGFALGQLAGSSDSEWLNPLAETQPQPTPRLLNHLSFTQLRDYIPQASQIQIEEIIAEESDYISQLISFRTEGKKVTGQLNKPRSPMPESGFPVIIMLRGYVNPDVYQTGIGTRNAAGFFAQNGFATVAPDFLGFGGSDMPDSDSIAARLMRPVTVINLIASLQSLDFIDTDRIFIWGHSNGGQIALSILQITGKEIPTTLWAPVSVGFPYSILYYTSDSPDGGRALRQAVAAFEANHNSLEYSIDQYWDWINAPIQIHQGARDTAVPTMWSDKLAQVLKDLDIEVEYFTYPNADHNMRPDWDTVIQRDLSFFQSRL